VVERANTADRLRKADDKREDPMATREQMGELYKFSIYNDNFRQQLVRTPVLVAKTRGVTLTDKQAAWFKRHRDKLLRIGRAYNRCVRAIAGDKVIKTAMDALEEVKKNLPPLP